MLHARILTATWLHFKGSPGHWIYPLLYLASRFSTPFSVKAPTPTAESIDGSESKLQEKTTQEWWWAAADCFNNLQKDTNLGTSNSEVSTVGAGGDFLTVTGLGKKSWSKFRRGAWPGKHNLIPWGTDRRMSRKEQTGNSFCFIFLISQHW